MLPETLRQAQQASSSSWGGGTAACSPCSGSKSPEERRRCSRRVLATGLLSLSVAFLLVWESGSLEHLAETPIQDPGRVLLVTAHPDDEVIFFASTISAFHDSGHEVFLLCLTNGDAHGLGGLRQRELRAAARAMQIDSAHLSIVNDSRVQDGHNVEWDDAYVASLIHAHVERKSINTIITFDPAGVTGHKNHNACYNAVRHYISVVCGTRADIEDGACPKAWALTTTDEFRTHLSLFDIVPSAMESRGKQDAAMFVNHDIVGMFKAMSLHKSQSRWWRHVLLTRYTFVNTLERVKPLITDWTLQLPAPEEVSQQLLPAQHEATLQLQPQLQPQPNLATGSAGAAAAAVVAAHEPSVAEFVSLNLASPAGGRKPLERGAPAWEAAQKRDHFMTRMSRRVMRSPR